MHQWMIDHGHYGSSSPEDYQWEGDTESVAIMAIRDGMTEFRFVWEEV